MINVDYVHVAGCYPARLKKVLIVTAPLWFKAPFKVLRLFVREKLRDRVFTVSIPQVGRNQCTSPYSLQTMGCSLMILSDPTCQLKNEYYFQNLAKNKNVNNKVPRISYGIAALNRSLWFNE